MFKGFITIVAKPFIEMESPFIINCHCDIKGDSVEIRFIGDYARAKRHELLALQTGDRAFIEAEISRDKTLLVHSINFINDGKVLGRHIDFYA